MNKSDLVDVVATASGVEKASAANLIDALTRSVVATVARGDQVDIPGFGVFKPQDREAREGKNPKTGKPISIAAKRMPRFEPGVAFKLAVAQGGKKTGK